MADYDAVGGGGAFLRLVVTQTGQSIPNNESYISWSLTLYKGSFSPWTNDAIPWAVNINGSVPGGAFTFDFSGGATSKLIGSGVATIPHNSDGTKTMSVSSYIGATGTSVGGPLSGGGNFVLTTIPRATTPTFEKVASPGVNVTSADAGTAMKIELPRASGTFTHNVYYLMGSIGETLIEAGADDDVDSWTIPLSLMNEIPSNTSGIITIRVKTYSGATLIGTSNTPLTMTVPTTVKPDFTTITNVEATPGLAANVGGYVQGLTTLLMAITGAVGAYGSTIPSNGYKIEVAGQTINASGGTSTPISSSGTVAIIGTVTDSRGRVIQKTVNVTVLAYSPPTINSISVQRALVSGTPDDNGTYMRVNINALVQSLIVSAAQKNALVFKIYTRSHTTGGAWTLKTTQTPGGVTYNSHYEVGTYSIASSWDVRVEIIDDFLVTSFETFISTAAIFQHWDADLGVGLGKYRQNGMLDVLGDIYMANGNKVAIESMVTAAITAASLLVTPIGSWRAAQDDTESAIWKLANGQAISRTDFAAAFAYYGTRFGVGDGSTTFNLPNMPPGGNPSQSRGDVTVGTITAVAATDIFTSSVAHGLVVGDLVYANGGTMMGGMTANQVYAVKSVPSATTFTLSSTTSPTGTQLNVTSTGSGTRTLYNTTLKLDRLGGEMSHIQQGTEVGAHQHSGDTRDYDFGSNPGAGGSYVAYGATAHTYRAFTYSVNANAAALAMNNMDPFIAANWFVRVA